MSNPFGEEDKMCLTLSKSFDATASCNGNCFLNSVICNFCSEILKSDLSLENFAKQASGNRGISISMQFTSEMHLNVEWIEKLSFEFYFRWNN